MLVKSRSFVVFICRSLTTRPWKYSDIQRVQGAKKVGDRWGTAGYSFLSCQTDFTDMKVDHMRIASLIIFFFWHWPHKMSINSVEFEMWGCCSHLDWGTVLSTKRKMAFSEGSWMRFLMIHMNWATVMSEGTRYFLLSMSTIWEPQTFSTITWSTTRVLHTLVQQQETQSGKRKLVAADAGSVCLISEERTPYALLATC